MALEGTLRDFSFADILQLISLQRKTGVLTLKNEDDVVNISFLDGKIVGADSLNQHAEDRVGLILMKKGKVTEAELEAALNRQQETLQRLGAILVDHKIVERDDVREALEQQMLQIIYRVFRLTDGEYHFSQETDIDYDEDLLDPMGTDSIIMEGARMTDEWPFIDRRIPDRQIVVIKTDHARSLSVQDDEDELEEFGFNFTESPEEAPEQETPSNVVSRVQHQVYQYVSGSDSVDEIVQGSAFNEFETCKALAELLDRGLVREATPAEVAQRLHRISVDVLPARRWSESIPWLAVPFLILLGFSMSVMFQNPFNLVVGERFELVDRFVLEPSSWLKIQRLLEAVEVDHAISGIYPETLEELVEADLIAPETLVDPWGRPYRLVSQGRKLIVMGANADGQPVPSLIVSQSIAWEGMASSPGRDDSGVVLID